MIDYPDLEIRNEDRLAAEAIARVSGGLTTNIINAQIRDREEILKLINEGLSTPVCPELTNANPSAPHTVLLEAFAWMLAQQAYRINQIPEQNLIAFANLFGIDRRVATAAETLLTFVIDAPVGTSVKIPIGSQVSDSSGEFVFETVEEVSVDGSVTVNVRAIRTVSGHTLLAPNSLTELIDPIAFVDSVANQNGIDAGTAIESIESVLSRVKNFQRRGERIVTAKDLEDAILEEALNGNGIVRVFSFIADGEFSENLRRPGHTTVIAMTRNGDALDAQTKTSINNNLLPQVVGSQFVYLVDPVFVDFNVIAKVKLTVETQQTAILTAIQQNLRNFYAPSREQFGRAILRSEIIAVIEGTPGVDRIVNELNAPIITSPNADLRLRAWELARLTNISLTIV